VFSFLYGWVLWIGLGVGAVLGVVGWLGFRRAVFVYRLEGQIPQVLRMVADAVGAGMGLREAFEVVAGLGLYPANAVFRRVLSLAEVGGLAVDEALWRVASELPSPNFRRFALIVAEGARSGARLGEVLGVAARSFAVVVDFRRELWSQLRPYVALFYAVVAVYVVLADVLVYFLLPSVAKFSASGGPWGGVSASVPPREELVPVLFLTALAQSVIGGLIVGRLAYFSPQAGLLHSGAAVAVSAVGLVAPAWLGWQP